MAGPITYFDVTDVLVYLEKETSLSGIQRVSFEVITRAIEILGRENVRLSYWDKSKRAYYSTDLDFLSVGAPLSMEALNSAFYGRRALLETRVAPTLERYVDKPVKYRFHRAVRFYHARQGNDTFFRRRGSSLAEWRKFHAKTVAASSHKVASGALHPVELRRAAKEGDRLVILGAFWSVTGMYDPLQELKDKNGLKIVQLVHDLVPLLQTKHLVDNFSSAFYYWMERTMGYCSTVFANSESTARDVQRFMDEIGADVPLEVLPLAQRFTSTPDDDAPEDDTLKSLTREAASVSLPTLNLTKTPYVLVVGTMESRKNGWRLAQAWKRLAEDRDIDAPKLVFAGKAGWGNADFEQLMRATGNLGGWVQIVNKPTDVELRFLYKHCLFTAMVSNYEGWGLPIGEGLAFGKTAVVADNSSMPEVGGDLVEYCDATSIRSIYDACRLLIAEPDRREALEAKIAAADLRTWDNVTADLLAKL